MLTREEQIAFLEKQLNGLLVHAEAQQQVNDIHRGGTPFINHDWAKTVSAVTDALIYLRGLPNPRGVHQIQRPKRPFRISE